MRKTSHKIAGMILAVILCFSLLPMTALAAVSTAVPTETPPVAEPAAPESTAEPSQEPTPAPESVTEAPAVTAVEPELVKVVDGPLVKVEYRYYDESANQNVTDFAGYAVQSTHSFYAVAMAAENDAGITVAANKHPGIVPVSTDALRFRILLNGSEDITSLASYDAASGLVTLPYEYMGHELTIEWYRPASEIAELPLAVTVCSYERGAFVTIANELFLSSDADSFSLPLMAAGAVVSQNGIELPESAYGIADGMLTVSASPLGGEVRIAAYTPQRTRNVGGQVAHTRGSDQIYYGYYTHYFTANGNTAFCLNPSVPSIPSGAYPVSRYLQPGRDDLLIKCGYYLYGGPGYDAVKHNLFENPDSLEAYGLSHAAASYAYSGSSSEAFHGLDSGIRNHLMNVLAAVGAQAMPPEGFEAFVYNEGDSATQSFMGWNYTPTGNLEIVKVSNNPAMTDGNPCYSLEDAVFDVYDGGNSKVGSITTDANGHGRLDGLAAGSGYYLVEVRAPKGYAANTQSIPVTIVSGQTVTATVTNVAQGDPVTILLRKQDAERGSNEPQGGGTMAGALFTVKFYKGLFSEGELAGKSPARSWAVKTDADGFAMLHPGYLASGDPLYYDSSGRIATLPLGTVTVQETQPPEGYLLNPELYVRHITAEGSAEPVYTYNEPVVPDNPVRGGVSVEKWDFDLNRRAVPQGDATLSGAVFEIYNRNPHSVIVNGQTFAPGAVVHTMTTDETGTAATANDLLPYGTYEIIEQAPPTGYLGAGVTRQTFRVTSHGVVVSLKTSATAIKNNVIRGGVEIEKWDIERNARTLKQGDATLAGAVFEIWNRSPRSVVVNGREYGPNQAVHTLTTNAGGRAGTANDLLPYGSYEIIEKAPPEGYLNTGMIRQSFQIRGNGAVVSLTTDETVIKNNIIRGGVRVEKWDNEIDEHRPQGGATFEGAVFEIVNRSLDAVLVQDKLYGTGEVVYVFSTDATGSALTPSDLLPYGTYEVREVSPPEGYLATGVLSRTFTIREHGKIVELDTSDTAIKNNPIRGDLRGVKISDGDAKRLANVPFAITSKTTGESHVIVTDKNGEFSTATAWNPHSQNTNRGETDRDGVWFGELRVLTDELGALLYDTYLLEELPCESNEGYELLTVEVSVYRHMTVVDLGTLTDDHTPKPEIFTTAMDKETMAGFTYVSETTTILDTVYYSGLKPGEAYTVRGMLMDKATGEPLLIDGKEVTAEKEFRAAAESGSVPVEFTFDSVALAGKSVVVFESLIFEGAEIALHADIEDGGQTVTFMGPKIGTSAAGPDGEKVLDISSEVTLVDTVSFENLIAGESYTLKGILMDKATVKPLLIDGKEVTAETGFKAEAASGTAEVEFTLNSAGLAGKTVVVFELLRFGGREIAVHADIEDEGQTITFREPKIGTTAAAEDGSKAVPLAETVTVVDTVSYENLAVGETYILKGTLMDKESGRPVTTNGKPVTAETSFVAKTAAGIVEVRFTFDSRAIGGSALVVFESLEYEGKEIAVHADINDGAQSVTVKLPEPPAPPTPEPPVPGKAVPQTGDDYMVVVWLILAGVSLPCLLVGLVFPGKKKRGALIAVILSAALLMGGGFMAYNEWRQYEDGAEAYAKLEQYVTPAKQDDSEQASAPDDESTQDGQTETPPETAGADAEAGVPASALPAVNFAALRELNPDIAGWLVCEGTPLNYPVARGSDNSRYLNHLYDGSRGKAGTPFLDYENDPGFADRNSIVYGHNLLDGSMFSCLAEYIGQGYYDAHPSMLLLTPGGARRMEIFAVFAAKPGEAGTDTSPWRQAWDTNDEFAAWLAQAKGRSVVETEITPGAEDTVLTLSTCVRGGRDRLIVMGRLIPAE